MAPKAAAAAKKAKSPRNPELVPGVNKLSRAQMAKHRYFKLKKIGKKEGKPAAAKKAAEGAKAKKTPRFYPTDDVPKPLGRPKTAHPTKLRKSIKPGQVLILVAGRFRGKRVVFLKQLPSGLLLVTGPYKLNGVPIRRVNQAFCIATATQVDISKVAVPDKINDAYFGKQAKAERKKKGEKTEEEFFGDKKKAPKKEVNKDRLADQKAVDGAVLESVKKVANLSNYLSSCFTLTRGQYPHELVF